MTLKEYQICIEKMLVYVNNNYCLDHSDSIWDNNFLLNPIEGKKNIVENVFVRLYYEYLGATQDEDENRVMASFISVYNKLKEYCPKEIIDNLLEATPSIDSEDIIENDYFSEETISHIYQIIEQLDDKNKNKISKAVRDFFENKHTEGFTIDFSRPIKEQISDKTIDVLVYIYSFLK